MKVLCLGDSNTWGYDPRGYFGGRYDAPWPELLAEATGWQVVNLGENGRTVPAEAGGLPSADRLLVMLGTNDLLQGAPAEGVGERMEGLLSGLARWEPVLICPPRLKRGAWVPDGELVQESRRLGQVYEALARRLGISFVDTRQWELELAFDGVHLTEQDHWEFARRLAMVLTEK